MCFKVNAAWLTGARIGLLPRLFMRESVVLLMRVDVITDRSRLLKLRDNWNEVYAADPDAQFFLSWTWMSAWLACTACSATWTGCVPHAC